MSTRSDNIHAAARLDVCEDELPRSTCSARGCARTARYAHAGRWGTFWLCSRHLPRYREHDRILRRMLERNPR